MGILAQTFLAAAASRAMALPSYPLSPSKVAPSGMASISALSGRNKPRESDYKPSNDGGLYLLVGQLAPSCGGLITVISKTPHLGFWRLAGRQPCRCARPAGRSPPRDRSGPESIPWAEGRARQGLCRIERHLQGGRQGMDREKRAREDGGDYAQQDLLTARHGLSEDRQPADDHHTGMGYVNWPDSIVPRSCGARASLRPH